MGLRASRYMHTNIQTDFWLLGVPTLWLVRRKELQGKSLGDDLKTFLGEVHDVSSQLLYWGVAHTAEAEEVLQQPHDLVLCSTKVIQ